MLSSKFQPGQEVLLSNGSVGVLYARTWPVRKRFQPDAAPTWYFLPDARGSVGMVVMNQPREIEETDIERAGAMRPGSWPAGGYWLTQSQRQAVYVAHMRHEPLPSPEPG